MTGPSSRRHFLASTGASLLGLSFIRSAGAVSPAKPLPRVNLALSAASLMRTVGKEDEQLPMLELPRITRETFELPALVLDNGQFATTDSEYLEELRTQVRRHQISVPVIRVEGAGDLGPAAEPQRSAVLSNHRGWVDCADAIGCPAIRVVWRNYPVTVWRRPDDLQLFVKDSVSIFRDLCDYAADKNVRVLLANDQGPSSFPDTLREFVERIDHPSFGLMPDVRGFARGIDHYTGLEQLIPFARAVTVRCYDFNDLTGEDTTIDYARVLDILYKQHEFTGTIELHYAGHRFSEAEGIRATRDLLLTHARALLTTHQ